MLEKQFVFFDVPGATQAEAVRYLVEQAARLQRVRDVDTVVAAVLQREAEGTTGFGHGIAIPHGKSAAVTEPTLIYGRMVQPVDWQAMDGQPVSVLFMILVPEASHNEHLQMLAQLARRLMHADFVEKVSTISDVEQLSEYVQAELA
ncbi:PTS sugar transporter subunit IIA [Alicyclobacillus shizuokensis]|uniref:PTS sugar transporter subunit IIA n=1 Tax=Alicyclobacillus shizuokensis TaxID=392014 RepID=UPI000832B17E|nr:fructose PTS transporter subunit IIA [Alicyclobacillus shizuokensis]